jgi:antitoxin ChpS
MHAAKIDKWGNSAALRLTADVLKEARLKVGTPVLIEVTPDGVLLKADLRVRRPTLTEMLAACDLNAPMPADLAGWDDNSPVGSELL